MSEEDFYNLEDKVGTLGNVTDSYYPTVDELKKSGVDRHPDRFVPILMFFSEDPFTRLGLEDADNKDYKDLVGYSRKLLYRVSLT